MRLLIHGINYAPEIVGSGKYTSELVEWLAARGHRLCVHTARPYYPHWRVPDDYDPEMDLEHKNRIEIHRHAIYVPDTPTGFERLRHHTSWLINSRTAVLRSAQVFKPDIVISIAPSLLGAPVALHAARRAQAPCVLHVQDFEVGAAAAAGLIGSKPLLNAATWIERALIRRFDYVTTICQAMQARLHDMGLAPGQTDIVPNWADLTAITGKRVEDSALRQALGLGPDITVLLYAGTISRKQGLDMLLEAARQLTHRTDIKLLIFGDGPSKARFESRAEGLPNVIFGPLQPDDAFNDLLAAADIHVLPQIEGAADLVLPSKLTGMLASGRPVIATTPAISQLARQVAGVGLATPPGDVTALCAAICQLADAPHLRAKFGRAARLRARAVWNKDFILSRFETQLETWVSRHRARNAASPSAEQIGPELSSPGVKRS